MPDPKPAPRAPQARSLRTRQRLVDACVESLVEDGHAASTTQSVCRRAGVSQGALFKHFETKLDLWIAAVEPLFARLLDGCREELEQARGAKGDRVSNAVQALERVHQSPLQRGAFELMVAARSEAVLARALVPVLASHREALRREVLEAFAGRRKVSPPDAEAFADLMLDAMQGRGLSAALGEDPRQAVSALVVLYRLARSELAGKRSGRV